MGKLRCLGNESWCCRRQALTGPGAVRVRRRATSAEPKRALPLSRHGFAAVEDGGSCLPRPPWGQRVSEPATDTFTTRAVLLLSLVSALIATIAILPNWRVSTGRLGPATPIELYFDPLVPLPDHYTPGAALGFAFVVRAPANRAVSYPYEVTLNDSKAPRVVTGGTVSVSSGGETTSRVRVVLADDGQRVKLVVSLGGADESIYCWLDRRSA